MNTPERASAKPGSPAPARNALLAKAAPSWHSRGYIPHFESDEVVQHVTFHLNDSLPKPVIERLEQQLKSTPEEKRDSHRRKQLEDWIDAGHGSNVLREPEIAAMVQNAFLRFDTQRYRLLAWVVMPNHVHVLFQVMNGWTVARIVDSWKKFTGRRIAEHRGFSPGHPEGVWQREYWDRYIRHEGHFRQAADYIHNNPVKAGLAERPEAWPWSSANREHQSPGAPVSVPAPLAVRLKLPRNLTK
jgi:putative transposase